MVFSVNLFFEILGEEGQLSIMKASPFYIFSFCIYIDNLYSGQCKQRSTQTNEGAHIAHCIRMQAGLEFSILPLKFLFENF